MKYSIITINYNNKKGLERTIQSVINQTFTDYEYIIIDGGSTDGSVDVIQKYENAIHYWVSEPDKGIYNAMNKGVAQAHGEYLNFMNSGDCFYTNHILASIDSKNYTTDIITGKTIGKNEKDIRFSTESPLTFLTLYRSTISHQSSFIKLELLKKHPYAEDYKIVSDWEFWIKTLVNDNCTHTFDQTIIAQIDLSGISISDNIGREEEREQVLKCNIPKRILDDYKILKYADDEMVSCIAKISKTYHIRNFTLFLLRTICKFI